MLTVRAHATDQVVLAIVEGLATDETQSCYGDCRVLTLWQRINQCTIGTPTIGHEMTPKQIAQKLWDDLEAGKLKSIGIDQIRVAIKDSGVTYQDDAIEQAVCREVVKLAV